MRNIFLLFVLTLLGINKAISQAALTSNVLQQPCNNDGILQVTATGLTPPLDFIYYFDNTQLAHSGVTSLSDQVTFGAANYGGYYYVYVTDANGNTAGTQGTYTKPFTFNVSYVNPTCPATLGTITASITSGPSNAHSFVWTENVSLQAYTGNPVSVPEGSYNALITDLVTGCAVTIKDSAAYIYQLSNVNATATSTNASCSNGTATVVASGGVTPYNYLWNTGATTTVISNLTMGYYNCVVTDAQGCKSPGYAGSTYVQQVPTINVNTSVTNATCIQPNGSAIAFGSGGVGPYSYVWDNGQTTQTATGLLGGQYYQVVATDNNGCKGTGYASINSTTPITVTYTTTTSLCTAPTGSATLTISGGTAPYTTTWSTYPSLAYGPVLSNVGVGTYYFEIVDAVGCVRNGSVIISPSSNIYAYPSGSIAVCPNNTGTASIIASGTTPPFTYLWSNGATTNQISGVPAGGYSCTVTDAVGCSVTKYVSIGVVSPVNVNVNSTPASCLYSANGTAVVFPSGGTAPYTYYWSNGQTTSSVGGLGVGYHSVSVTDANGCSGYKSFYIVDGNTNPNCYCTISGKVYVDANSNCSIDGGEVGVNHVMIHCSGFGYTFTDANGNYSFKVPTGTYTITQNVGQFYPLAPCQSNNVSVSVVAGSGCSTTVNFADNVIVSHDLHLITCSNITPPIPGNNYHQKVIVQNDGTVAENNAQLGYEHDGQLVFGSSTLPSWTQQNPSVEPNWYSVQSGFPGLAPGQSTAINLSYNTPTNIPLGTSVVFYDSISSAAPIATDWLLDQTPWNNVNTYYTNVVGSWDPNFKEVSPKGNGPQGYIATKDSVFDYVIHFQNEGTYFAQNISVIDTLDVDLNWTSLRPGYSDHNYTATVSEAGVLTFKFANINLPWKSSYGDALSSGLVTYSIKRKSNVAQGTVFTNKADIYFDYNSPVTTNTTINTLDDVLVGVKNEVAIQANELEMYPNPAKDVIYIRVNNVVKDEIATLTIMDITGKVIQSSQFNLGSGLNVVQQKIPSVANGIYLTRVQFEDGKSIVKKIVISNE